MNNVLTIGDLHTPFDLDEYLHFCKEIKKHYKCKDIIFLGDVIDNHYSSYHESDPDGYSAGEELDRAIDRLQKWYKAFPNARVLIGNHDRMSYRKAFSAGVSSRWIREYKDVLKTPKWDFLTEIKQDGVYYIHGEGRKARARLKTDMVNVVQGHYHTDSYIEYVVGKHRKVWCMQVGCGMDQRSYAAAYAKDFPKMAIGCGLVLKDGKLPILELMEL